MIPALLLALAVAGSACGGAEGDVLVFAAASAGDVVRDLAPEAMALSVAASSTLARQIRQGAPADVFVSADARWADWLEAEGVEVIDRKTV
ncbi:MAG: substrate-binding domain-containing protein, partial [Bacteroidota bacterium]